MKKFNSCMPKNFEHILIWILKKSYRAKDKQTSIGFKFEIFLTSNKEDRGVQIQRGRKAQHLEYNLLISEYKTIYWKQVFRAG